MFYRIKENKLYDNADYKYSDECLETDIITSSELRLHPNKIIVSNGVVAINPNYEREEAEKERNRISKLSVTKSDFFDATIKAFGLDANDLLPIVSSFISKIEVSDTLKKIALNNYQNAKDFYRNHELFNVLAGNPIVINDQLTIVITSEQFDNYFKKASQHDPEAYKEFLPITGE